MYEIVITVDCKKVPVECGYLGGSDKQGGEMVCTTMCR